MLTCQMVHAEQASHSLVSPSDEAAFAGLTAELERLEARVRERFRGEGVPDAAIEVRRSVTVRYAQQVHTVEVAVSPRPLGVADSETIRNDFEERYAQVFGTGSLFPAGNLEYEMCRVMGTRAVDAVRFNSYPDESPDASDLIKDERPVHFDGAGFLDTPVYDGETLRSGNRIAGPAVIERMGDSVVVPPGVMASVDPYLTLLLTNTADTPEALVGAAGANAKASK
jgi:N-methylhydantoinase A